MMELWNNLKGKRTKLCALGLALLSALCILDQTINGQCSWLSFQTYAQIGGLLGGGTAWFGRDAIDGLKDAVEKKKD